MSSMANVLLSVGSHTPRIRRYSLESIDMSGRRLPWESVQQTFTLRNHYGPAAKASCCRQFMQ